ncbi:Cof-type HAD-IIB family hydrolase [Lactiplantibacillus pentosus]|uniref:Cof-type HAD-IIB family hydrolase n=1 Tax=Lactiplantibacillus pentosus TaxID=1589 RepID=UPI001C1EF912|nr:Cof-type HAD-IIB family hydrolase [Lactiplantibacillus pentosus]MBU7463878.1 HAD family hydrolase [Lactiplantibacillus pentosus]MBU7489793.1 HAD family hydrolase [Lactiplantibacillus pentosus]MBU7493325.1 HAD family hydrolase [Lactiplantibacillus pentosus]MBU7519325.1 HAD family hydrolase [Lactiplantibacillus pentosus]MBU7525976.1 HAD family hydrolase [Lactiplantibacillus pentosus]
MTIKLVATDMDGTFLNNRGEYDQKRFAKDYAALRQRGIQFVIASGHQAAELATTFSDYPDMWMIGGNGAELWQRAAGLTATTFSPTATQQILTALSAYDDLQIALCGTETVHVLKYADPQFVANMQQYYYRVATCDDLMAVTDPVVKFDIICPPALTDQLVYELTPKLAGIAVPASGGQGSLDLIQPGMHKGRALKQLGAQLGIAADGMLVFGDGTNDLEMFHYAGHAVAMHNAPANVRANATAVTGTNIDNGVLDYLEKHLLS